MSFITVIPVSDPISGFRRSVRITYLYDGRQDGQEAYSDKAEGLKEDRAKRFDMLRGIEDKTSAGILL